MYKANKARKSKLLPKALLVITLFLLQSLFIITYIPENTSSSEPPTADAGSDQTVYVGETVHFNGNGTDDSYEEVLSESQPEINFTDSNGGVHTHFCNAELDNTSQEILYDTAGNLSRIDISFYASDINASNNFYQVILSFNDRNGTLLGSASIMANRTWKWYTFRFSPPIQIEAGGLYNISMEAIGKGYPAWCAIGKFGYDAYPRAHGYFHGRFKEDFTFKTYLQGLGYGPLEFKWDFDANVDSDSDGNFTNDVDATGKNPTYVYTADGIYNVTLTVTDIENLSASDTCQITVLMPSILPPILYIDVISIGDDVLVYWDPPPILDIDHYLLYRSTSQNNFNFSDVWINTSQDIEVGETSTRPLRTSWNDTNSTNPANSSFEQEYYYTIRAVNIFGETSSTSRTVGKWTKKFSPGISTFSLPLEPINSFSADNFVTSADAKYIKYMDNHTQLWRTHLLGDGVTNNTQLMLGKGYEVEFQNETSFTFTGMPAAMISYDSQSFGGFDPATEADSLDACVGFEGNVTLTWAPPGSLDGDDVYKIYRSSKRDGYFFGSASLVATIPFGTELWTDVNLTQSGTQYYYMIVPENETGEKGSGTYSVGVWTEEYKCGYDTLGIPLKIGYKRSADWYCENIPEVVGINYFDYGLQLWMWHSYRMPEGAFDPQIEMTVGYQISTRSNTRFTFIGT
jgi:PKD repeat protein